MVAVDSQAAIRAVEHIAQKDKATSEEGRARGRSIQRLGARGARVRIA